MLFAWETTVSSSHTKLTLCINGRQVKIFGGYTRWAVDLAPPDAAAPARVALTAVDAATAAATGSNGVLPGPAHLNCQFREPLGPVPADWPRSVLQASRCMCSAIGCCVLGRQLVLLVAVW